MFSKCKCCNEITTYLEKNADLRSRIDNHISSHKMSNGSSKLTLSSTVKYFQLFNFTTTMYQKLLRKSSSMKENFLLANKPKFRKKLRFRCTNDRIWQSDGKEAFRWFAIKISSKQTNKRWKVSALTNIIMYKVTSKSIQRNYYYYYYYYYHCYYHDLHSILINK